MDCEGMNYKMSWKSSQPYSDYMAECVVHKTIGGSMISAEKHDRDRWQQIKPWREAWIVIKLGGQAPEAADAGANPKEGSVLWKGLVGKALEVADMVVRKLGVCNL
jgi:hypothetical protein